MRMCLFNCWGRPAADVAEHEAEALLILILILMAPSFDFAFHLSDVCQFLFSVPIYSLSQNKSMLTPTAPE